MSLLPDPSGPTPTKPVSSASSATPSSSSRPRRSIVLPARLGSTPPTHPRPPSSSTSSKPPHSHPTTSTTSAASVVPMETEEESGPATKNPLFSLPMLKKQPSPSTPPKPIPASSSNNTNAAGVVQGDDDQCPSCLGPVVPTPVLVGGGGGGGKGKGKEKPKGELLWICCEMCESWYHYACVRTRSQGVPEALGPDTGHWNKELNMIDKWYCTNCASDSNVATLKKSAKPPTARKSARPKPSLNYLDLHLHSSSDPNNPSSSFSSLDGGGGIGGNDWPSRFADYETKGKITLGGYVEMRGEEVQKEAIGTREDWEEEEVGVMACPVVARAVDGAEGLEREVVKMGGEMPDARELTVRGIAELNGPDTPVEVVDVANQSSSKLVPGTNSPWTLGAWASYYDTPADKKPGTFNIISYEITGTPLAKMVKPPRIVSELDWVDRFWPQGDKLGVHRPKVQLYCLMSPSGCFTDWHVDFAGSSVYYHILKGSKVFWFIRPTKHNLDAYARWSDSANQSTAWLGDQVDKVWKIVLGPGDTMIIPSGWIHAVYTPSDSLVFGGNFLHSYDVRTQIRMRDIEIATKVPQKFRFPRFTRLCWYVAEHYLRDLQAHQKLRPITAKATKSHVELKTEPSASSSSLPPNSSEPFSPRLLDNILVLASFLVRQVRHRERGTGGDGAGEKETDTVPWEKVKDPAGLARELRWRAKLARGEESEDENDAEERELGAAKVGKGKKGKGKLVEEREREESVDAAGGGGSSKRRRVEDSVGASSSRSDSKLFAPAKRPWDGSEFTPPVISTRRVDLARPGSNSSAPVAATETTRQEMQVQTRQRFEPNGEIAVEISTASRTIVKLVWEAAPAPRPPPPAARAPALARAPVARRVEAPAPPPPAPTVAVAAPPPPPPPAPAPAPVPQPQDLLQLRPHHHEESGVYLNGVNSPNLNLNHLNGEWNAHANGSGSGNGSDYLHFGDGPEVELSMDVDVQQHPPSSSSMGGLPHLEAPSAGLVSSPFGYGMLGAAFGGGGEGGREWSASSSSGETGGV
ncbi:hypothetical protein BDY24DRAFT_391284 [Mrakia frigida]|uniref:[Histone H3]-lysine-36 demethylase n=1 Tax=Mrakia frigida TaxID=29902 RepID=UPI003FCC0612